jgi:serine/threonine protein kinase
LTTALRRGSRLGKYRLERRIGRGGFAEVWKVRDTVENRLAALKITFPEAVEDWGRKAIEHEARIACRLHHPSIVTVRNADWIDGRFVIATDLAKTSLNRYTPAKRSGRVTLEVVRDVAAGLAFAHARRVMHRDLKPENILIFDDGRAALADFAAVAAGRAGRGLPPRPRQGTRPGLHLSDLRRADQRGDEGLPLVRLERELLRRDHPLPARMSRVREGRPAGVELLSVVLRRALRLERPQAPPRSPGRPPVRRPRLRGPAAPLHALLPPVQAQARPRLGPSGATGPLPQVSLADPPRLLPLLPLVRSPRAPRRQLPARPQRIFEPALDVSPTHLLQC